MKKGTALLILLLIGLLMAACSAPQKRIAIDSFVWPLESANPKLKALRVISNSEEFPGDVEGQSAFMKELLGDLQTDFVDSKAVRIATDGKGVVYVAAPRMKYIQVIDFIKKKFEKIEFSGVFPAAIDVTQEGRIFVGDRSGGKIFEMDRKGTFLWTYGTRMTDEEFTAWESGEDKSSVGRFYDITDIFVFEDKLYVTDQKLSKVEVLTLDGNLVQSFPSIPAPIAVMVSSKDRLMYVLSKIVGKLFVYDLNGAKVKEMLQPGDNVWAMNFPNGIAMDSEENLYIIDTGSHGLKIYNKEGEFLYYMGSQKPEPYLGAFNNPKDVIIDDKDRVYILDAFNMRLVVLEYLGEKYRTSAQNREVAEPMLRR